MTPTDDSFVSNYGIWKSMPGAPLSKTYAVTSVSKTLLMNISILTNCF